MYLFRSVHLLSLALNRTFIARKMKENWEKTVVVPTDYQNKLNSLNQDKP